MMDFLGNNAAAAPDRLAEFCRVFLDKNRGEWPADENSLAAAFLEFFKVHFAEPEALKKICHILNIRFSERELPKGMKGYNHRYNGERTIVVASDQFLAFEHTLLHELRELMEYVFCDFGAETATGTELEKRAEQFAISVRILIAGNGIASMMKDVEIESTWKRRLTYLAIVVGGLFYIGTCALLPYLEDRISEP